AAGRRLARHHVRIVEIEDDGGRGEEAEKGGADDGAVLEGRGPVDETASRAWHQVRVGLRALSSGVTVASAAGAGGTGSTIGAGGACASATTMASAGSASGWPVSWRYSSIERSISAAVTVSASSRCSVSRRMAS